MNPKSLNPSHPDCECEQCQEMLRRARAYASLKNEAWHPYFMACLAFEQELDRCHAYLVAGTLPPKGAIDRLNEAKRECDDAYALYHRKIKTAYEKYPIAHHA